MDIIKQFFIFHNSVLQTTKGNRVMQSICQATTYIVEIMTKLQSILEQCNAHCDKGLTAKKINYYEQQFINYKSYEQTMFTS